MSCHHTISPSSEWVQIRVIPMISSTLPIPFSEDFRENYGSNYGRKFALCPLLPRATSENMPGSCNIRFPLNQLDENLNRNFAIQRKESPHPHYEVGATLFDKKSLVQRTERLFGR